MTFFISVFICSELYLCFTICSELYLFFSICSELYLCFSICSELSLCCSISITSSWCWWGPWSPRQCLRASFLSLSAKSFLSLVLSLWSHLDVGEVPDLLGNVSELHLCFSICSELSLCHSISTIPPWCWRGPWSPRQCLRASFLSLSAKSFLSLVLSLWSHLDVGEVSDLLGNVLDESVHLLDLLVRHVLEYSVQGVLVLAASIPLVLHLPTREKERGLVHQTRRRQKIKTKKLMTMYPRPKSPRTRILGYCVLCTIWPLD